VIVVLADDVSGAAELAGIAVANGLDAVVQTRFAPTSAAVCCVDLDTRRLSAAAARRHCAAVTSAVLAVHPRWVFKKIDSVLRGHVAAETQAMLDVGPWRRALLVPANPSRGRTIRDGCYLIGGVPLDQTVFASDPEHPRLSAAVQDLLGCDDPRLEWGAADSPVAVARSAARIDDETLAVGAGDLFAARIACLTPTGRRARAYANAGRRLYVCGSPTAWRSGRLDECRRSRLLVFTPEHDLQTVATALVFHRQALVTTRVGSDGAACVRELARMVAALVHRAVADHLFVEGGATGRAVLDELRCEALLAEHLIAPGLVALRPSGLPLASVVIKPGSYAWPTSVWPQVTGEALLAVDGPSGSV
jgi:uncharacterized protein YgbK (DUF1537 family)